jgi:hypothetical protein
MKVKILTEPFPHVIVEEVYEDHELELIWEELNFFTKPGKLMLPKDYGAAMQDNRDMGAKTSALAIPLTPIFSSKNSRNLSGILTLETILLDRLKPYLREWKESHYSLHSIPAPCLTWTKLRYYHDNEGYETHTDAPFAYVMFSYFHKEPKKFTGGELFFEQFDNHEFPCNNNTMIIIPPYVAHGVRTVKIDNDEYYSGNGRYAVTTFIDYDRRSGRNAFDYNPMINDADLIDWWKKD